MTFCDIFLFVSYLLIWIAEKDKAFFCKSCEHDLYLDAKKTIKFDLNKTFICFCDYIKCKYLMIWIFFICFLLRNFTRNWYAETKWIVLYKKRKKSDSFYKFLILDHNKLIHKFHSKYRNCLMLINKINNKFPFLFKFKNS